MTFSNIAHYDSMGFWMTWFDTTADQIGFLKNIAQCPCWGDPSFTYSDIEKVIKARIRKAGVIEWKERLLAEERKAQRPGGTDEAETTLRRTQRGTNRHPSGRLSLADDAGRSVFLKSTVTRELCLARARQARQTATCAVDCMGRRRPPLTLHRRLRNPARPRPGRAARRQWCPPTSHAADILVARILPQSK